MRQYLDEGTPPLPPLFVCPPPRRQITSGIEDNSDGRRFTWTVEGWAGTHRYAVMWTGDDSGSFECVARRITSFGAVLCGLARRTITVGRLGFNQNRRLRHYGRGHPSPSPIALITSTTSTTIAAAAILILTTKVPAVAAADLRRVRLQRAATRQRRHRRHLWRLARDLHAGPAVQGPHDRPYGHERVGGQPGQTAVDLGRAVHVH
jgi:hypothetical protein